MSGLDSSQQLTDQASLQAEQFHVHSHPERAEKPDDAEGAIEGTTPAVVESQKPAADTE